MGQARRGGGVEAISLNSNFGSSHSRFCVVLYMCVVGCGHGLPKLDPYSPEPLRRQVQASCDAKRCSFAKKILRVTTKRWVFYKHTYSEGGDNIDAIIILIKYENI